jgi:hypothetical protein
MGLDRAIAELATSVDQLSEAVDDLRLTVTEDHPRARSVILVDRTADSVLELAGRVAELHACVPRGVEPRSTDARTAHVARVLVACQPGYDAACAVFVQDLTSYATIADLVELGHRRGGEWRAWVKSVRDALERCREPLMHVNRAISHCWGELVEVSRIAVSVDVVGATDTVLGASS